MAIVVKQDKNRPVRLAYTKIQKGWSESTAPEKLVIVYQGKNVEIPYGDQTDLMMPFRVAQHYIAKQKNWGTGRNEGNGGVLEIVELTAVKGAVKKSTATSDPAAFDVEAASYPELQAKAKELGIELPGNVSKVDLKAKLVEGLAAVKGAA